MDFLWHLLATISITLPHVLGYNLLFGKGKIFHFGPIGVSLACAYALFLTFDATGNVLVAFLAGGATATLLSIFFSWLALRLEPDGLGVLSIAVHLMVLTIVLNWNALTRGALGIPHIPRLPFMENLPSFALVSLLIATVWTVLLWRIHQSTLGRKLTALAEHHWHAQALGIDRWKVQTVAFLIAGAGALITAMLYPQYLALLHPNDYRFDTFIFTVMVVIAGGPGNVPGVVLSTTLLLLLKEGLRFLPLPLAMVGPLRLLLFGGILFAAVWLRRDTLFPKPRTI